MQILLGRVFSHRFRQKPSNQIDVELEERMIAKVAVVIVRDRGRVQIIPRPAANSGGQLPSRASSF